MWPLRVNRWANMSPPVQRTSVVMLVSHFIATYLKVSLHNLHRSGSKEPVTHAALYSKDKGIGVVGIREKPPTDIRWQEAPNGTGWQDK